MPAYGTILVVVNGSEASLRAGEHAVYLAKSARAELFVLSVVGIDPKLVMRAGFCLSDVAAEMEREGRCAANAIEELATANGVECVQWAAKGRSSWRSVAEAAREIRADCVVVGYPRTSRDKVAFFGEGYNKALESGGCPVLLV